MSRRVSRCVSPGEHEPFAMAMRSLLRRSLFRGEGNLRTHGFALFKLFEPAADPRGLPLWSNAVCVHAERAGI